MSDPERLTVAGLIGLLDGLDQSAAVRIHGHGDIYEIVGYEDDGAPDLTVTLLSRVTPSGMPAARERYNSVRRLWRRVADQ